jgi:hypothetical protein
LHMTARTGPSGGSISRTGHLDTFDIAATYDKINRALELAATLNAHRPPKGGRGNLQVAGAGLKHLPPTPKSPPDGPRRMKERWHLSQ